MLLMRVLSDCSGMGSGLKCEKEIEISVAYPISLSVYAATAS